MNLKINHRLGTVNVDFFNNFTMNLKYDSIASTFAFDFYFDPNNREHAEMACVSHFHEAIVQHNGETLITGYLLSQIFKASSKKTLAQFGGYSKSGVLEDCEIPTDIYPLQADGLSLSEIAKKITSRFKLKMIVDPSVSGKMNQVITKTTAGHAQNIKSYLTEIATQRDIVMTHNENGDVVFTKAKTDLKPVFNYKPGMVGVTDMTMSFGGQAIHSQITVMKQAGADDENAGEYTIKNPYCPIVYRPKITTQSSGDDVTIEQTAKHALAAELKNIVLTVTTDRWEFNGKLIRPNNIIRVLNRELFIYKETDWFIESIQYTGDNKKNTAVLTCVPVEVYNGKTPKNIFVDPHQNLPRIS